MATKTTVRTELIAAQQPDWPDPAEAARAYLWLASSPPLTSPAQIRRLSLALRRVCSKRAFVLQAGDCAEPFDHDAVQMAGEKYRLIAEMATAISARLGLQIVTIGRIAGQFAKPRSQPTEIVDGQVLPVFRGLLVNSPEPEPSARVADPRRMLAGYRSAALVLAELDRLAGWNGNASTPFGETRRLAGGRWTHRGLWTSHEALILDYEQPLIRRDPRTGKRFLLSTHQPWVGERSRQLDGEHVAMLAGIANPIAAKIGPLADPDDVLDLCARIDPAREPGRLTLICRLGADHIRRVLPPLVRALRLSGHPVIWMCDPMHGNTRRTPSGLKTRSWSDIIAELTGFLEVMETEEAWPGGVHLEVAGRDVTECVGGPGPAEEAELGRRYESLCDPRLNRAQSVLLAEYLADLRSGSHPGCRS